jgi:hypothetical protein
VAKCFTLRGSAQMGTRQKALFTTFSGALCFCQGLERKDKIFPARNVTEYDSKPLDACIHVNDIAEVF